MADMANWGAPNHVCQMFVKLAFPVRKGKKNVLAKMYQEISCKSPDFWLPLNKWEEPVLLDLHSSWDSHWIHVHSGLKHFGVDRPSLESWCYRLVAVCCSAIHLTSRPIDLMYV